MNEPVSNKTLVSQDHEDSDRLHTLYTVNTMLRQVVADGLDINEVLPQVLRVALKELQAPFGSIVVIDRQSKLQHAWLMDGDKLQETASPFLRTVVREGLFAWATHNQKTGVVHNTQTDERWLLRPGHSTAVSPWSAICSPIIVRSRPVGAITMTKPGASQFDRNAVDLLEVIANQAASTIESARLYRESQQQAQDLAELVSAAAAVSTSLNLEEVLQGVVEQMVQLVDVDISVIFDWDREKNELTQRVAHFAPRSLQLTEPEFHPLVTLPIIQQTLRMGTPTYVLAGDDYLTEVEQTLLEDSGINSVLLQPLVGGDQTIGLILLADTRKDHILNERAVSVAQMLAAQASIAIQNARLYEDTERQLKVSALLNEASKVINSTLDTNQILQLLLSQMNELLNAQAISIALVDKQRNELVYEVAEGLGSEKIVGLRLPSSQGVSGWVMENGQPALVPATEQDPRFNQQGDQRTGHNTQAMICAPLQVKGDVLGTVQAINPRQGTFTESDLQLLVSLANLASSALNNAQQFARTQAAEARYLSLFEDSVNPILLSDTKGNVVEANRRASEFLGYQRGELLGVPIEHLHISGSADSLPSFEGILPDEITVFISKVRTNSHHAVPVEVYVKRTLSGDNELIQWIYRDTTHEVELEEMREDLMAMLVHDLQSPLGNVISSLELMRYELPPDIDPVLGAIIDIAARSSSRLQTLIRSLLDITRLEAGHPITEISLVTISSLLNDAREVIEPTLQRRHAELVLDLPDFLPEVLVDADMIRRVFINLLDNASKYTPEGRRITVKVSFLDEAGWLLVGVSDQGRGVPVEYREIIFDKFRRLQGTDAPKGMGLGLAFCRLAVEAHGGHIWIDDAPGGGARFNFTLPYKPAVASNGPLQAPS